MLKLKKKKEKKKTTKKQKKNPIKYIKNKAKIDKTCKEKMHCLLIGIAIHIW